MNEIIKAIGDYGVTIVATAILLYQFKKMFDNQISEMKNISIEIKRMADKMNKTQITNTPATVIWEASIGDLTEKMMQVVANVLVSNNLDKRETAIKNVIKTQFENLIQITQKNMHYFITPNGYCLADSMEISNLDIFYADIFTILFSQEENYMKKLWDIRQILGGYVNKLRTKFTNKIN